MSVLGLLVGCMLFVLGIFAVGYYVGVDSERRRARKDAQGRK